MSETLVTPLEIAVKFKFPSLSSIIRWINILNEEGLEASITIKNGRPSMKKETKKNQIVLGLNKDLLERIKYLEMENNYLKKLNGLVQKEELSKTRIKHK